MSRIAKMRNLKTNVVNATKKHTATLFFFHGSGSFGKDMKEWVDILSRGELNFPHIKIVYPTAPAQPYTPNSGMLSNVWFDRKSISIRVEEELESVNSMCDVISEMIENEVSAGIPHNRMMVGGFSMGGALAMHVAYRYMPSLAGCFALSSFLNVNSSVYQLLKENPGQKKPALLQFHGNLDTIVPYQWGEETSTNLKSLGVDTQFTILENTDHELNRKEVESLKAWILKKLPENQHILTSNI